MHCHKDQVCAGRSRQMNSFGRRRGKLYAGGLFESLHCRGDMTTSSKPIGSWRTPSLVIGCGCLIAIVAFGPRSTLGFFLTPMSTSHHWGRDVFAFALALQNLLWGIGQPLGGMIADRFGTS